MKDYNQGGSVFKRPRDSMEVRQGNGDKLDGIDQLKVVYEEDL